MLPNEWKKVKLEDVADIFDGTHQTPDYVDEGVPFVSVENIEDIWSTDKFITKDAFDAYPEKPRKNDILMTRITAGIIGKTAIVDCDKPLAYYVSLALIRCKKDVVSPNYMSQYIEGPYFKKELNKRIIHTAFPKKINLGDIGKCMVEFPPIEEQKKIAATLSVWDSAIEKMEKLIESKESQKNFLIAKSIKFSDDKKNSGLTKIKLSDVFDEVCEKNHPDEDVLTIIQGVGTVLRKNSGREIIYDKDSLSNYKYVKKGDFIIHLRSFESGLEVANQDGIVSPAYIILRPKIKVETVYLYSLFHTNEFINRTIASAVEGARDGRSVKYDVLKKQTIILPCISEQKSVAELFLKIDNEISLLKEQLENYKKQKQGLMQKLLTGQWRVKLGSINNE
jgi:type I restriction enzyme S subunit